MTKAVAGRKGGFRRKGPRNRYGGSWLCYLQVGKLTLFDILVRATDLSRQLRQSPRLPASIPVELRGEEPGGAWEEETRTKSISPHGALLECQHPVRAGEILLVMRLDTGRQVQARVARRQRKIGGPQEIGIEFPDRNNFWDVDWSAAEAVV